MKFDLVTPQQRVLSMDNAAHVQAPGMEGDFGVLPGHMPFISTLREGGKVHVTDSRGKTHTYVVNGGFAEVSASGVSILAESISEV